MSLSLRGRSGGSPFDVTLWAFSDLGRSQLRTASWDLCARGGRGH